MFPRLPRSCCGSALIHRTHTLTTGAVLGGSRGAYTAVLSPVAVAGVDTTRLRVNQLLNTSGKLGRSAGVCRGIVAVNDALLTGLGCQM